MLINAMIHQELQLATEIHRFELTTNSSQRAYEKAFNLYGVLIIPTLIGGVLMYNAFQLREEYFIVTLSLLIIALVNIYLFYQRVILKNDQLKLIIENDSIQLMDNQKIYFQGQIKDTNIQFILCGKHLKPALIFKSEDLQGVIIGLKNIEIDSPIQVKNQLCQPDYWFSDKRKTRAFLRLIQLEDNI